MNIKNERGIALLTVLFIIVVFTILGISILTMTVQGSKVRGVMNEESEGKMLADIGLQYFQSYLEHHISPDQSETNIKKTLEDNFNDKIIALPDGKGAFEIMYNAIQTIPFSNPGEPPHPYSKKLKVSVIGIPNQPTGDASSKLVKVKLDATVYINTILEPFHYAVSTPGDLYLYGGSNIIGNIQVGGNLYTSTSYLTLTQDNWQTGSSGDTNKPYIQGNVMLNPNGLTKVSFLNHSIFPSESNNNISTDFDYLKSNLIFMPRGLIPSDITSISADPENPDRPTNLYIPGYEPPHFKTTTTSHLTGLNIKNEINNFSFSGITTSVSVLRDSQPIAIESNTSWNTDGSFQVKTKDDFDPNKYVIYSQQNNSPETTFQVTTRLTGDQLNVNNTSGSFKQLYIGPSVNSDGTVHTEDGLASVEMGRSGSFKQIPDNTGTPFTFTGPIYIRGNLDIVGDIDVQGTIYVDGDVVIREISNVNNRNLVILATGKITLSNRYDNKTIDDLPTLPVLSAFIYSDRSSIDLYSVKSFNRILGGIGTGNETNTPNNTYNLTSYPGIELGSLDINTGALTPTHVTFSENVYDYSVDIPSGTTLFTIIPKLPSGSNQNVKITINGEVVRKDTTSKPIDVSLGTVTISVSLVDSNGNVVVDNDNPETTYYRIKLNHPQYIMLSSDRADEAKKFSSRNTIQFNRGIFETIIPGLPSANHFYYDIYDRNYSTFQDN